MQEEAIAANEKNNDVILLSSTGSGKTLAFLIPVLKRLDPNNKDIQALILAPSRELAIQIEQVFKSMSTGFKVNCCYGGHAMSVERKNLSEPPTLLIGTPGRILDHIHRRIIDVNTVHTLVLDEFDKSLELGFQEEMSEILARTHYITKRILTSATNAIEIPEFAGVTNPTILNFLSEKKEPVGLKLNLVKSEEKDKTKTLFQLVCMLGNESTLVFCNHRESAEYVSESLKENNVISAVFHGGLEQHVRERALAKFRNGSSNLLICTDLASRGLDIPEIKNIIHYHLPLTEEAYIHRNGRTARMNAEGSSYMIINNEEIVPKYITENPEFIELEETYRVPAKPNWITLYLGKGKKDKLNKVDIVGFLAQKGNLKKEEIGLIEVKDFFSYVAVKRSKVKELLSLIANEKIKNMKTKIEISD